MKVSIIGFGYWGINLVRNVAHHKFFEIVNVCDIDVSRLDLLKKHHPWINASVNTEEVLSEPNTECIIIATPPHTHFNLAEKSLKNGKHVLVEKPLCLEIKQAEYLQELADEKGLCLMTDLTFLYNGAVRKIKQIIERDNLGTIQYIDSTRINLGLFQNDINVLWDLATHDLSIINYIIESRPISVSAHGVSHLKDGVENIAYLIIKYPNDLIVHIHSSWSSPVKIRQMLIGGDKKMLIYNDIEPTEKIKVYDSGFVISNAEKDEILVDYRIGDMYVPKYDTTEALKLVINDFYNSAVTGAKPLASTDSVIAIMKILFAAQESMINKGIEIFID